MGAVRMHEDRNATDAPTGPELLSSAVRERAIDALGEDAGRRLIEQAFHYWEQTVHDLQREVKALRGRLEKLERMHEEPQPVKLALPEATPAAATEERQSRAERHRKSRWF